MIFTAAGISIAGLLILLCAQFVYEKKETWNGALAYIQANDKKLLHSKLKEDGISPTVSMHAGLQIIAFDIDMFYGRWHIEHAFDMRSGDYRGGLFYYRNFSGLMEEGGKIP